MAGVGGYQKPTNPAPVSGPGAMSQRTDGGPGGPQYVSGLPYGEGQDFYDIQTSAPMGAPPAASKPRQSKPGATGAPSGLTPFGAPTERPDQPLTAGIDSGPGPGSEILPSPQKDYEADVNEIARYLPSLEVAASFDGAPRSFKAAVRYLQGMRRSGA